MRSKEELIDKYAALYRKAVSSKDPKKMKVLGEAGNWVFAELAKAHPEMAENWIAHLETMDWDNWLSEKEAQNVTRKLTAQDGTKGAHWPYETFTKTVAGMGGKAEDKPSYNGYALWAVANNVYADHARSIAEDMGYKSAAEVPGEKMAKSCYAKAVELLKDPDKGFDARKYFKRKMYDNAD